MGEPVDLYSVGREKTGRTAERYTNLPDNLRRYVVHVCIFDGDRMLIQKRVRSKRVWPGYWDVTVGGGVTAGEEPRRAAMREVYEELGIRIDLEDTPAALSLCTRQVFDDFYIVNMGAGSVHPVLQEDEVEEVMWADKKTINRLIAEDSFIPYNSGLITYLFHVASRGLVMYRE